MATFFFIIQRAVGFSTLFSPIFCSPHQRAFGYGLRNKGITIPVIQSCHSLSIYGLFDIPLSLGKEPC